jgi:hypothetical protein
MINKLNKELGTSKGEEEPSYEELAPIKKACLNFCIALLN